MDPETTEAMKLEQEGWQALSAGAENATTFYDRVLDDQVIMVLPGGLVLDDRQTILTSMAGQPWSSHDLTDWRVLHLSDDTVVVTYRADARRVGADPYSALMSSVYVRRETGWRLAFHQQTPR
jgi:hypothetical protein